MSNRPVVAEAPAPVVAADSDKRRSSLRGGFFEPALIRTAGLKTRRYTPANQWNPKSELIPPVPLPKPATESTT